ncbi:MAG: methylenetetrahydrofolate reductase C-terminal domain-containing protein [Candidatus Omnitrophica bacterium]|nr:methylenetetrahydrofolate reductase C-terminal domain-containing protein [Candidatus Omnitrophota bacterium]MBU4346059.1 methylenetetrahydrofolate reductase C-terminal domain-containing protein [Candidatus Omnitrophota bacterium]MBU4473012.1 methylenetetrahydrofolate reductase C-terminal domain-containing protein [Candidatus Omnitrophota bacterium]MCG2706135.1 methylenetetrahydrofolate reductase C-terminal domain-containing protein [Candidatus Omnitrophota bacterium]
MIISQQKPLEEIVKALKDYNKVFLIGCGECATTCKSGGKDELLKMQQELERNGKIILGACIPDAPCVAAQIKTELAKNIKLLRQADAVLVLACGLGVQSVKDNDRLGLVVLPACNTLFGAAMDSQGNFYEKCSMCGECVLDITGGICPITLCSKGLLNGPCGGVNRGKCEADKERDCAWVLIYKEMEKRKKINEFRKIQGPKDFKKAGRPRQLIMPK